MQHPWRVLGVHRLSTEEEIRAAFLKIARKTHPDVAKKLRNKITADELTKQFSDAANAYRLLMDRKRMGQFLRVMVAEFRLCNSCQGEGVVRESKRLVAKIAGPCPKCLGAGALIRGETQ